MPEEWEWASHQVSDRAVCCGILGGNDLPFLARYADLAIRMIRHPRNRVIWRHAGANAGDNVLFEQYLLAACLEYHHIAARYLFDSMEESFDEDAARQRGYTHLIGGAKRNRKLARALQNRVARDYPERYERCCSLSGSSSTEPRYSTALDSIAAATAASV
jgi:hypothetical protein